MFVYLVLGTNGTMDMYTDSTVFDRVTKISLTTFMFKDCYVMVGNTISLRSFEICPEVLLLFGR